MTKTTKVCLIILVIHAHNRMGKVQGLITEQVFLLIFL